MNLVPLALVVGLAAVPFTAIQDPAARQEPAPAVKHTVEHLKQLSWICGTWAMEKGGKTTEEHWRPLQGTTILGSSHSYDGEKTHFFEHLRISLRADKIAYLAMPGGAPATAFLLRKLEAGVVEFENPKHDHPQLIRYEKTAEGVTATVSLLDGTRAQRFVFKQKG